MRRLQRAFGKQHAVVAENADLETHDAREAGHQRVAVERLELMEFAVVDQAGDDLAVVGRHARVGADQPIDVGGIEPRRARRRHRPSLCRYVAEIGDDVAGDGDGMAVAFGEVVGNAR